MGLAVEEFVADELTVFTLPFPLFLLHVFRAFENDNAVTLFDLFLLKLSNC